MSFPALLVPALRHDPRQQASFRGGQSPPCRGMQILCLQPAQPLSEQKAQVMPLDPVTSTCWNLAQGRT